MKLRQTFLLTLLGGSLALALNGLAQDDDPTKAPADVKAPPADAEKTASGLAHKVLRKGTGKEHPAAHDEVEVHYSGWTTDGTNFDSSYGRGRTIKFPLNGVIKGWTEGVQLMVVGEKRRFWIPADLAYGENSAGAPSGMLVFDIELEGIKRLPAPPKPPKDLSKAPSGAVKTASGLAYENIKDGEGKDNPVQQSTVSMHITGWDSKGNMMLNDPLTFPLKDAPIKGWVEGVKLMVKGDKKRFWIPESLGKKFNPALPAGMMVFELELLDFKSPIPAPSDVAEVPADAVKTATGLASKVITKGSGTTHPTATNTVTVDYTGWTTNGEMFDSSVTRGQPASFPLGGVIKGWTEGVQLMVVGEKRRFWIPAGLAYGENPGGGRPGGMLVFDIELHSIK